jgi:hypothetical protein
LDFIPLYSDFEGINLQAWVIAPGSIADFEFPSVPRTGDDAVLQVTGGKGRAHVRAKIVNRQIFSAVIEDGDHAPVDWERFPFAFGNGTDFGDGDKLGHRTTFSFCLAISCSELAIISL